MSRIARGHKQRAHPIKHYLALDFDHLEVFLTGVALRAFPIRRDIFPAGAGGDAFSGQAEGFFIDEAADDAHICSHKTKILVPYGAAQAHYLQCYVRLGRHFAIFKAGSQTKPFASAGIFN